MTTMPSIEEEPKFICPVCYFDGMVDPPRDYNICERCGTEFGLDDEDCTFAELRERWISLGSKWFFEIGRKS